jgi:uncharacterized protein (TIGR03083 family)
MEYLEHCAAVEREVDAIVEAVASGPVDSSTPTCPGWTVTDLVEHVGGFSGFWAHVLCEGSGRPNTLFPDMPSGEPIAGWYADVAADLVRELGATAADQSVWTWVPDRQNAAFVARRCAHELAIHRCDVQAARGTMQPIEGELAADGIEEIFVMIEAFAARGEETGRGTGETLRLHATDREDEWLVRLTPTGLQIERDDTADDLALRGAASDIELLLYQRPTIGTVEHVGDPAVLDAWYRAFHFG